MASDKIYVVILFGKQLPDLSYTGLKTLCRDFNLLDKYLSIWARIKKDDNKTFTYGDITIKQVPLIRSCHRKPKS